MDRKIEVQIQGPATSGSGSFEALRSSPPDRNPTTVMEVDILAQGPAVANAGAFRVNVNGGVYDIGGHDQSTVQFAGVMPNDSFYETAMVNHNMSRLSSEMMECNPYPEVERQDRTTDRNNNSPAARVTSENPWTKCCSTNALLHKPFA